MSGTPHNRTPRGAVGWRWAVLLASTAAVVCYLNVLPNDFCDDGVHIVARNHKVTQPGGWRLIWTTDYWSDAKDATPTRDLLYRPVALSSYRIVHDLFGSRPLPHHLVNIALHACISVLLVLVARRLGFSVMAAAAAGVLFATLPIHSEVINNVVGRADLLATAGTLAALLAHRRSLDADSLRKVFGWRTCAAVFVFVAMGAKESGVTAVFILVACHLYWRRKSTNAGSNGPPKALSIAANTAYCLLPILAYLVLRYHALDGKLVQEPALSKSINLLVDAPLWQHLLGVMQLWGMYWAKSAWPQELCVNYSVNAVRLATSIFEPFVLVGLAVAGWLIVWSVVEWRKGRTLVALLLAALVLAHLPTSNALALIQVFFAERLWYAPSVWACLLVGLALGPLLRTRLWRILSLIVAIAFIGRVWIRSGEWRNNSTLYAAAYRDHPNSIGGRYLYGRCLVRTAKTSAAVQTGIELLHRALEIDPGSTDSHRVLGRAYYKIGDMMRAVRHLQIADMQIPGHPPTELLLERASALLAAEQSSELGDLHRAAEAWPNDVKAQLALIRALRDVGDVSAALDHMRERDNAFTGIAVWHQEFAVTLVMLDKRDEAIERYRRCVDADPSFVQPMLELAMLLIERRAASDIQEAWTLVERAEYNAPNHHLVLTCRAELLALRGEMAKAVELYDRAIEQLEPGSEARRFLEQRAAILGRRE